jgi:hypothetical protein
MPELGVDRLKVVNGGSSVATDRLSHVRFHGASRLVHFALLMTVPLIVIRGKAWWSSHFSNWVLPRPPGGEPCTSGNTVKVVWCLGMGGNLLPDALWGPAIFLQLQSVSGPEKKQNTVPSTDFKNTWFYTSTPLWFKWDSYFSMVNILPTHFTSLPALYSHGFSAAFVEKKRTVTEIQWKYPLWYPN